MIKRNHSQRKRKSSFSRIHRERGKNYASPLAGVEKKPAESSFFGMEVDLGDCNEQESEKMGFHHFDAEILSKEGEATVNTEDVLRGENLPTLADVERSVLSSESADSDGAVESEERLLDAGGGEEKQKSNPSKKETQRGSAIGKVCVGILVATMLFAVLTLFASLIASRGTDGDDRGFVDTQSTEELSVGKPDRVVFVKQYDDESGILTTAELYAKCVDSVVSILTKREKSSGVGSGFFLTSDGYIATANHVVEGMDSLTVVEADGTRHSAVLVAGNALTDLALLKIEKNDCPPLSFASSEELLIGERVIAIGTPASLDYAGSVCSGELSYVGRRVTIYGRDGQIQKKMNLLQTDASLNPGNSGCPLFDEYGNVVGIVTMRLGDTYEGMGFAIPSSGAMQILHAMMQGEELSEALLSAVSTTAPSLGILGEAQSEDGICGVRVLDFSSSTAPISYILKKGDLIVQIDGTPVASRADVASALGQKIPGDTVAVTVLRGGQWLTFRVSLMSTPEESS